MTPGNDADEDPRPASPRFSVVIPALDEEAVIGACLRSLAAQDFGGPVEVIVVDNGSRDATAAIAAAHGATVVSESRRGVCAARERGRVEAHGEIMVSTDADTTFEPHWLRRIDDHFELRPDAVAVVGPCHFVDGPWWSASWGRLVFGSVHLVARLTGRVVYVSATNLAFRRDSFTGYDTSLTQGGDELDVLRRLRRVGAVVYDHHNPTSTSARRLDRGLLYSLVVSLGYYYLLGYAVNKIAGRPVLGTAPSIRPSDGKRGRSLPRVVVGALLTLIVMIIGIAHHELVS